MITPCDVCGNVDLNWDRGWAVSDEEWRQVVPERWRDATLCPWCFVKFAAERGKRYKVAYYPWDPEISMGVKKVEGERRMTLDDMRRELREKYERRKRTSSPIEAFDFKFERTEEYAVGVSGTFSKDGRWRYFKTIKEAEDYIKAQVAEREFEKGSYLSLELERKVIIPEKEEKIGVLSAEDMRRLGYWWDKEKRRWRLGPRRGGNPVSGRETLEEGKRFIAQKYDITSEEAEHAYHMFVGQEEGRE